MDRDARKALFERLCALNDDTPCKGKKTTFTSMNGNMIAFLSPRGDVAVRMAKAERGAWLEEHPEAVVVQHNTVMKDYVGLHDELLADEQAVREIWQGMVAHARTLEPKPTKKPRKKPANTRPAKK